MSLASEIIQDAFDAIGRGSEILSADTTMTNRGLLDLRSIMETLRKKDIILEETVSGVTTTIALPTLLTDELDEPTASRMHLVNILAVYSATQARINLIAEGITIPTIPQSIRELSDMYRVHTIPCKVPSKLLPRGQGSKYGAIDQVFFDGSALEVDVTET